MQALVLGFCSSGYDFAIPSSRLHLTVQTLGITMWFVGNYAHCGLSPQTDGVPVILIKKRCNLFRDCTEPYIENTSLWDLPKATVSFFLYVPLVYNASKINKVKTQS